MTRRPHVLVIVSDDHGYADRGALGVHADVRTPGLDRLAAEGTSFEQAYVTAPICSPSRAGLISGQYQNRWGAEWFASSSFPAHRTSLAEALRSVGYRTGYFGKVHYGNETVGDRGTPPHHGFQETFYGLAGQQMGRLNYLHHSRAAVAEYGEFGSVASAVQPMLSGDEEVEFTGHLTAELGRRARDFITRAAQGAEPFFCMLAFNAVHNFCWQLPADELRRRGLPAHADYRGSAEDYLAWYDGQISPQLEHGRDYYLAQLDLMDAEIATVLDTLHAAGVGEDTLVVYLTDNGGSPCNFASNDPLSGSKYTLWEGGIRVPLILRWPAGGVRAGHVADQVASSLDLYPTILAAAGAAPDPACDGVDLLSRGDAGAERTLHWEHGFQWAVRHGDWKLTVVDGSAPQADMIRTVEHAEPGSGTRLFNLAVDPAERDCLAARRPDVVAELTRRHEAWRREVSRSAT